MSKSKTKVEGEFHVYRRRWAMLVCYIIAMFIAQLLWIEFTTIPTSVTAAFGGAFAQTSLIPLLTIEGPIVSVVFSFPFGAAVDKWGWRNTIGVSLIALAVIGVARSFVTSLFILLITQMAISIVGLSAFNGISKLTTQWFTFSEGATAQGLGTLAVFLGIMVPLFLSPIIVGMFGNPLFSPFTSVQDLSLIYGFAAVVVTVIFWAVAREKPPKPPEKREEEEAVPLRKGFGRIFRVRNFWVLSAVFFGGFITYLGLTFWIENIVASNEPLLEKYAELYFASVNPYVVPYLLSIPELQGGIVGALITFGGIIGCVIIPTISDRINRRKPFMILAAVTAPFFVYIIGVTNTSVMLTIPGINISISVVMLAALLLGFFLLPALPVAFQMAMETKAIGPMLAGLALGGLYTFGNAGGGIGPLVMEFFQTSSLPYMLASFLYTQNLIAVLKSPYWFLEITSVSVLDLPGSFYLAILFVVIVGILVFIAVWFLRDTHAEKAVETQVKAKTKS